MTEFEKMRSGLAFNGEDASIASIRNKAVELTLMINQSLDSDLRREWQNRLFGSLGKGSIVQTPFYCEFGQTISIGRHSFLNMNITVLDGADVTIGDHVLIGPNTQFYTPSHPMDFRRRREWETCCKPIVVEDDVWIGGNVVINQGVRIGARSVVAASSVVTRDVPPDTLVAGAPARVVKLLNDCAVPSLE